MNINTIKEQKTNQGKKIYVIAFFTVFLLLNMLSLIFLEIGIVNGVSMNPTLRDKDIEISLKTRFSDINRQDIVNIESAKVGESIVKRVIGIAGDTVAVKNGEWYVNGQKLEEPYIQPDATMLEDFSITVPKAHIYVLGDNRGHSLDSRTIGCVPLNEVKSELLFIIPSNE